MAYVVWVPQLGAEEKHVRGATRLASDGRARHFWDPKEQLGRSYARVLFNVEKPVLWDFYMLFARSAKWNASQLPVPDLWMHQLNALGPAHHLDAAEFAAEAQKLLDTR